MQFRRVHVEPTPSFGFATARDADDWQQRVCARYLAMGELLKKLRGAVLLLDYSAEWAAPSLLAASASDPLK